MMNNDTLVSISCCLFQNIDEQLHLATGLSLSDGLAVLLRWAGYVLRKHTLAVV